MGIEVGCTLITLTGMGGMAGGAAGAAGFCSQADKISAQKTAQKLVENTFFRNRTCII
jgi:hypothetical protein